VRRLYVREHTLGKGEVESSILSHSTIYAMQCIDISILYNNHTRSDPQSVPHFCLNGFGWMNHIGLHLSEKKIAFARAVGGGDLQVMRPIQTSEITLRFLLLSRFSHPQRRRCVARNYRKPLGKRANAVILAAAPQPLQWLAHIPDIRWAFFLNIY
jgi:hypothetical protein